MNRMGRVLVLGALALAGITGCKEAPPPPAELHRDNGNEALNKGDWKAAAQEFEQSLQADPKQEKLWEKLAYCYQQAGDLDKSDEAILHLLDFKTDQAQKAEVYRNLASLYLQNGHPERAEKYFLKTVEIEPKDDLSLSWLAEIYAQRGHTRDKSPAIPELLDKSFEYYDKVIALKPEFPNTYINKRIAVLKYMQYEQSQKETAEAQAKVEKKDKAKVAELKAKAEQAQARMDEFKKQYDELTAKWKELAPKAKAAAAGDAGTAGQAPPAPPAQAQDQK